MPKDQSDNVDKTFPMKLKKLRQIRGWSQGQLGKRLGVSVQRVSKYENGVISPPIKMAVKIANIFDVSLDYLLGNERSIKFESNDDQDFKQYVQEINLLPDDEKRILKDLIDAYIKRSKFRTLMNS